jgi:hypothetical protein
MRFFLTFLVLIIAAACVTSEKAPKVPVPESFTVTAKTIQVLGPLDSESINTVLEDLRIRSKDEVTEIYFYAGLGAVKEIQELVNEIKSRKTICYAHAVADFVVAVFQACSVRLIDESSVIARSTYPQLRAAFPGLVAIINRMEMDEVRATGKSKVELEKMVSSNPEYRTGYLLKNLQGFNVTPLGCDPVDSEMTMTTTVIINNQPMPITAEVTVCPLTRRLSRIYITDKTNKVQVLIDGDLKEAAFHDAFRVPLDSVEPDEPAKSDPI